MARSDEEEEPALDNFEMLKLATGSNGSTNTAITNSGTEESTMLIPTPSVRNPPSCRTACTECEKELECPRMFISSSVVCPHCNCTFLVSEILEDSSPKPGPSTTGPSAALPPVPMGFGAAIEVQPERQDALQLEQTSVHHAANNIPPQILQQERSAGQISTSFQGIQRSQRETQVVSLRQEEVPAPNSTGIHRRTRNPGVALSSRNMQPIAPSRLGPSATPIPEQRTSESSPTLQKYQAAVSRQGKTMAPSLAQTGSSARRLAPIQHLAPTANYTAAEQLNITPYVSAPILSAEQVLLQREVGAVAADAQAANIKQEANIFPYPDWPFHAFLGSAYRPFAPKPSSYARQVSAQTVSQTTQVLVEAQVSAMQTTDSWPREDPAYSPVLKKMKIVPAESTESCERPPNPPVDIITLGEGEKEAISEPPFNMKLNSEQQDNQMKADETKAGAKDNSDDLGSKKRTGNNRQNEKTK